MRPPCSVQEAPLRCHQPRSYDEPTAEAINDLLDDAPQIVLPPPGEPVGSDHENSGRALHRDEMVGSMGQVGLGRLTAMVSCAGGGGLDALRKVPGSSAPMSAPSPPLCTARAAPFAMPTPNGWKVRTAWTAESTLILEEVPTCL